MKKSILLGLVCLGVANLSLQAQEGGQSEFSVSALGSFQRSSSGNGINQSANGTPGVLFSYRYFFSAHHGFEMDYGYRRYDQQFSAVGSSAAFTGNLVVPADTHEGSISYVFRFASGHRLKPFVNAGVGALVFAPTSLAGNAIRGTSTLATGDFVYGGGADMALSPRLNLRVGYRGHFFEAPDLGLATLYTGSRTHMAEPFVGLSFRF
jgi:outer membrane immunogenic protein